MATYVLIPGAGSDSYHWHLVKPRLEELGHDVVAPDLPTADDTATFSDYADVVVEAVEDLRAGGPPPGDLIVVGQSMGGFTAPIVCYRLPARLLVLVAAMVPSPGESGGEWWAATGSGPARRAADLAAGRDPDAEFDVMTTFMHDVPPDVVADLFSRGEPLQSEGVFADPWPLADWPDVPTRFLLCADDRFFPAEFQRRVVRERLGIEPDEMRGGHLPALAHPDILVERLEHYRQRLDRPHLD